TPPSLCRREPCSRWLQAFSIVRCCSAVRRTLLAGAVVLACIGGGPYSATACHRARPPAIWVPAKPVKPPAPPLPDLISGVGRYLGAPNPANRSLDAPRSGADHIAMVAWRPSPTRGSEYHHAPWPLAVR